MTSAYFREFICTFCSKKLLWLDLYISDAIFFNIVQKVVKFHSGIETSKAKSFGKFKFKILMPSAYKKKFRCTFFSKKLLWLDLYFSVAIFLKYCTESS